MTRIEMEDFYCAVYGALADDEDRKEQFLNLERRLTSTFLLVKHLEDCRSHAGEVIFFQRVRNQVVKALPGKRPRREIDRAFRDLVDDSITSAGVVDIFAAAGLPRADISILNDEFLQTYKGRPFTSLQVKLLEKLLEDNLACRRQNNVTRVRTFQERLEETLRKYHNRLIDAATVIRTLIEIKRDLDALDRRAAELGFTSEELAFYDAICSFADIVYEEPSLKVLVHDIVVAVKTHLKVDWTLPHREDVKSAVRAAVRRVLRRHKVSVAEPEKVVNLILEQATALYSDWPSAA